MAEMVHIDDTNYRSFINPVVDGEVKRCASYGMFEPVTGFSMPSFADQDKVKLIPQSEWKDRISDRRRNQATIKQLCQDSGLYVLDQNGTNYCWCNGVTFSLMVARLVETLTPERYSPASVAAPVKNYRNNGGWGSEALDYMIENGINLEADWPPNAISRSYYTTENREKAKQHRPLEFFRCEKWEEVVSSILSGVPVAVGYGWWGHLVCGVDLDEQLDLVIANSWGRNWSDDGFGLLKGNKKYPDMTSVAICSVSAM